MKLPDDFWNARRCLLFFLFAVVLASSFATGQQLVVNGLNMCGWDDSEYVNEMLNAYDHLTRHGLITWPGYIVQFHYVKPPLFVNSVIPAAFMVGRTRVTQAIAIVIAMEDMLLALAAFMLIGRRAGGWHGLFAAMAMVSLPAVSRWMPTAYPDAQLAIVVLASVGMLALTDAAWSDRKAVLFGILLGLGMMAKTTYPMFVGLPILYWLWRGGAPNVSFLRRLRSLAVAAAVGTCIAAPWYVLNWRGALNYAREATRFAINQPASLATRLRSWTEMIIFNGVGYFMLAIGLYGLVLALVGSLIASPSHAPEKRRFATRIPWSAHAYCLLGALPAWIMAMQTQAPPNTRHLLSTCVLLAASILILLTQIVDIQKMRPVIFMTPVAMTIAAQFALVRIVEIPSYSSQLKQSDYYVMLYKLDPALREIGPASSEACQRVVAVMREWGARLPDQWHLSGNSNGLNAPRLSVFANEAGLPVAVNWASYFSWPETRRSEMLDTIKKAPCMLVLYDPANNPNSDEAYINRYNEEAARFVNDPANGFLSIPSLGMSTPAFKLAFYTNDRVAWDLLQSRLRR